MFPWIAVTQHALRYTRIISTGTDMCIQIREQRHNQKRGRYKHERKGLILPKYAIVCLTAFTWVSEWHSAVSRHG
jgi:hypothetical protein